MRYEYATRIICMPTSGIIKDLLRFTKLLFEAYKQISMFYLLHIEYFPFFSKMIKSKIEI